MGAKLIAQPSTAELRDCSDFRMFGQGQCVLDVYTKVTHGTFNFVVAEQNLHSAQISHLLVDDGRLGST